MDKQVCTKCNIEKELTAFPSNGDAFGGYRKQCKECMRAINRAWRAKNKEKVKEYNKNRP